jgi:hypothetical protein
MYAVLHTLICCWSNAKKVDHNDGIGSYDKKKYGIGSYDGKEIQNR